MVLLWSSRTGSLRYVRIKQRSELSGYELTGVDWTYSGVLDDVGCLGAEHDRCKEEEEDSLYCTHSQDHSCHRWRERGRTRLCVPVGPCSRNNSDINQWTRTEIVFAILSNIPPDSLSIGVIMSIIKLQTHFQGKLRWSLACYTMLY